MFKRHSLLSPPLGVAWTNLVFCCCHEAKFWREAGARAGWRKTEEGAYTMQMASDFWETVLNFISAFYVSVQLPLGYTIVEE